MFERFTKRARRVIVVAQDEARELGHRSIRPEHLLLGLAEGEGVAAKALERCGVDLASLRGRVAGLAAPSEAARRVDKVPFSSEAKRVLEQSLRAALGLGHNYIGTEHVLLGVIREAEGRAAHLDELLGTSVSALRDRLMEMVERQSSGRGDDHGSPAVQAAMASASASADRLTTGDVLQAILADPESHAARALATLGVTPEGVADALGAIDVEETSDAVGEPPQVALTVGDTTVVITDADVVAGLRGLSADELRAVVEKALGREAPPRAS